MTKSTQKLEGIQLLKEGIHSECDTHIHGVPLNNLLLLSS